MQKDKKSKVFHTHTGGIIMNLEVYRNYVAIIDAGTISAASRELHIAQPALSN